MEENYDQYKKAYCRYADSNHSRSHLHRFCRGLIIDPGCDCIGVGVTHHDGITYCYMFVGIPDSVNFYA